MRIKLDENLGTRTQSILKETGTDVHTVRDESLEGASDRELYEICKNEDRTLITLDLDFANVLRFPPNSTAGIVFLRMPQNPSPKSIELLMRQFLDALKTERLSGTLWIVEPSRI